MEKKSDIIPKPSISIGNKPHFILSSNGNPPWSDQSIKRSIMRRMIVVSFCPRQIG
jgi:hypothetical protein